MRIVLFGNDRPLTYRVKALVGRDQLWFVNDVPTVGLAAFRPDIGVSVLYRHKLTPETLALFPRGVVNLHPGYLPWNRGAMPNVWPIVDGTPAGVTLHWVDEGIDTGDIIAQDRVEVLPTDTGKTLYDRLMEAAYVLFVATWPRVLDGTAPRVKQAEGGSYHRSKDVEAIDEITVDDDEYAVNPRWLIHILRARTFPPYKGCYFEVNGKRVYVRVELEEAIT